MTYRAAIIGTGPDPENQTSESFAMRHEHADGYEQTDGVEVVACADIMPEKDDGLRGGSTRHTPHIQSPALFR
jgi:predicted dehydrogenase